MCFNYEAESVRAAEKKITVYCANYREQINSVNKIHIF